MAKHWRWIVGLALLLLILTWRSLRREHALIERFLREEVELGTLPAEHAAVLPFWRKRRASLPPELPREKYILSQTAGGARDELGYLRDYLA